MIWKVRFDAKAEKELFKLDSSIRKIIHKVVKTKLLVNPKQHLIPLSANFSGLYKFRVGDYRLICKKEDDVFVILALKVKHRREVYKKE